jgi:4-hydroxy-tetrahydrodipicolinate synthase
MARGGVGCISATANINPAAIRDLYANWRAVDSQAKQDELNAFRSVLQRYTMIPALKAVIAHYTGDEAWSRVRPPLVELSARESKELTGELERRGLAMPGLRRAS